LGFGRDHKSDRGVVGSGIYWIERVAATTVSRREIVVTAKTTLLAI